MSLYPIVYCSNKEPHVQHVWNNDGKSMGDCVCLGVVSQPPKPPAPVKNSGIGKSKRKKHKHKKEIANLKLKILALEVSNQILKDLVDSYRTGRGRWSKDR